MAITREQFFDDELLAMFPEIAEQVKEQGANLFGAPELTAAERAELGQLESRASRLSPIQAPAMQGNNRISGNVFSVDDSPWGNALQQGLVRVLNAKRNKRLTDTKPDPELMSQAEKNREIAQTLPDDEEGNVMREALLAEAQKFEQQAQEQGGSVVSRIEDLRGKEEQAQQAGQNEDEFLMRMFPEIASQVINTKSRLTTQEAEQVDALERMTEKYGLETDLLEKKSTLALDELDKRLENRLTELAMENGGAGGSGGGGVSGQDINNFRQIASEMTGVIDGEISQAKLNLQTARANAKSERLSPAEQREAQQRATELEGKVNALTQQKRDIMNTAFSRAAEKLGLPIDEVEKMFLGSEDDQPKNNAGGGLDYNSIIGGGN